MDVYKRWAKAALLWRLYFKHNYTHGNAAVVVTPSHRHQSRKCGEDCPRRCTTASPACSSQHAKELLHTRGCARGIIAARSSSFTLYHLQLTVLGLSTAHNCCNPTCIHVFMLKQPAVWLKKCSFPMLTRNLYSTY